jgi:hypothetical protein
MDSEDNGDESAASAGDQGAPSSRAAASRKRSGSVSSTAQSRAAQRKVRLDPSAPGADDAPKPVRKVTKPPLYRRGGFWFLVILAEVLVALIISYRFERPSDSVDLAGTNTAAFCADVATIQALAPEQSNIDVSKADVTFSRLRDAYVKLEQSAPQDLQPDLQRLVKGTEKVVAAAQEIQRKKAEDPSYAGGVSDLIAAQTAQDDRLSVPSARLAVAVRNACNIDLSAPVTTTTPTTTAPTPSTAPSSGPSTGTTPSSSPSETTTTLTPPSSATLRGATPERSPST